QVKARLMKTAYKTFPQSSVATDPTTGQTYTSYYDVFTIGAGYLDLKAALASSDLAPNSVGAAMSPTASYNSKTKTVTLANGNSQIPASSVVWGTSVVWGSNSNAGFSVVWSTTTSSASSVVWGTSVNSNDEAFVQIA